MKDEPLTNIGKTENIKEPWLGLVKNVSNDIRQINDDLVAFYIVGSVVRGKAVEKQSDVDFLAVVNSDKDYSELLDRIKTTNNKLFPFTHHIDIDVEPLNEIINTKSKFVKRFVIQTQSVLLLGHDISDKLPKYRVNKDLAKEMLADFDRVIQKRLERISRRDEPNWNKEMCRFAMKELLRTVYFLTIPVHYEFTTEKERMFELIEKYSPEFDNECKLVKKLFYNPVDDINQFEPFYIEFSNKLKVKIKSL